MEYIDGSVLIPILQAFEAAVQESAAAPTKGDWVTLSGYLANDAVAGDEDLEVGGPRDGVCWERKPERDFERLARITHLTNQVPDKGPLIGEAQVEQSPSEHRRVRGVEGNGRSADRTAGAPEHPPARLKKKIWGRWLEAPRPIN
jgi:hypothetical protein